ncbi:glycoside hydrolase family 95 protein [Maribacter ulvicola]|uniref:Alpha-L-fucosidase 2 n=1 Tax=Maribacter ulvicola TaxID=228959 RepID=A0A1N6X6U3_9FLAO|nr:glycoside hydrolase family 95 protein [Maribacter ulvicola]SIQ97961.1 alpha-L-fucosidase 2 [Maribacter ulvicola]
METPKQYKSMNNQPNILLVLFLVIFNLLGIQAQSDDNLKLWFQRPANTWNEALPVGNGRIGTMVFGGVSTERLQLNEETIFKKDGEQLEDVKDGHKYIDQVRNLLFKGKYKEAEKLHLSKIMGKRLDGGTNTYQTLGDLDIIFNGINTYSDYYRELDLNNATVNTKFKTGSVWHNRTVFASTVDQAIVMKADASKPGNIDCTLNLSRPGEGELVKVTKNMLVMTQHLSNGNGTKYEARVLVTTDGGSITSENNRLVIKKANSLEIRIVVATDYFGDEPSKICDSYQSNIEDKTYSAIFKDHVEDYQRLFHRMTFEVPASEAAKFPTDERVDAQKRGVYDPSLATLYFHFGRYLLISSSRENSLPANLQGIWADGLAPAWNADYHMNINAQMNYWPSEITNLSECHLPFLKFIASLRENGRKTAKELYGARGFAAHHTTDLSRFTTAYGSTQYGSWPMGAAWATTHFWEHYLFTEDKEFLASLGYPVMKEASLFLSDFLVKNPKTGMLVTGPSMSPENVFLAPNGDKASLTMGPAMDLQIVRHLFNGTIIASEELGIDVTFRKKLKSQLRNLTPSIIGVDGRILEWSDENLKEALPGHRHISHLYGLYPSNEFNWKDTPEFMKSSEKVIESRLSKGGGHTGWSRGWIMNFYARLLDGDKIWENLVELWAHKTLPNLFDDHPPFQIDGNFGATAALAEMLLQSHNDEINILPALPKALPKGKITGLMARGGFEVDIEWENGDLQKVKITSRLGNPAKIRYGAKIIAYTMDKGDSIILDQNLSVIE